MGFNPPQVQVSATQQHCLSLSVALSVGLAFRCHQLMVKEVNVVACFFPPLFLICGRWTLLLLTLNCWFPQGKDDVTGEPLIQHDDDKPEALMARLRQYKDVAKPVIDLYKSVQIFILVHVCKLYMHTTNIQGEGWLFDVFRFLMKTNIPEFVAFVRSCLCIQMAKTFSIL